MFLQDIAIYIHLLVKVNIFKAWQEGDLKKPITGVICAARYRSGKYPAGKQDSTYIFIPKILINFSMLMYIY